MHLIKFLLFIVILPCLNTHAQEKIPYYHNFANGKVEVDSTGYYFYPPDDSAKTVFVTKDLRDYKMYDAEMNLLIDGDLGGIRFTDYVLQYGKWTEYYTSGAIKTMGHYDGGEPVGIWRHYYPNGQLKMIYTMSPVIVDSTIVYCKTGSYEEYYENGIQKVQGFYKAETDTMIVIFAKPDPTTGKLIETKAKAARSKPDFIWTYFNEEGEIIEKKVFGMRFIDVEDYPDK